MNIHNASLTISAVNPKQYPDTPFPDIAFAGRRRVFTLLLGAIDLLPNCYAIARRWNIGDHEKRLADGSIDYDLFELIGRKRGFLVSGGEVNTERTAVMLLDEFRGGKIGRITLEEP